MNLSALLIFHLYKKHACGPVTIEQVLVKSTLEWHFSININRFIKRLFVGLNYGKLVSITSTELGGGGERGSTNINKMLNISIDLIKGLSKNCVFNHEKSKNTHFTVFLLKKSRV